MSAALRAGSWPVLAALALAGLVVVGGWASSASARRARPAISTRSLDVIGPRSTASVRVWLSRSARLLEPCRERLEATVSLTFAIGPDGSLLEVRAREGEGLDPQASACVQPLVAGWRVPTRAASFTTVVWTLALAPLTERACFCFDWIHGSDFGISCEPTQAACEREQAALGRDHTECRPARRVRCDDEATIGGHRMRHD